MSRGCIYLAAITALVGYTMQQNVPHCKSLGKLADGTEICLECMDGFYLNSSYSSNICWACPNNCNKCTIHPGTNALICNNCTEGFRFNVTALSCDACASNCRSCNESTCAMCFEGYKMNAKRVCESTSDYIKYLFIVLVVVGAVGLFYWVYKNYFKGTAEDPIAMPEYDGANYTKEKDKELKQQAVFKGGRRANPDNN